MSVDQPLETTKSSDTSPPMHVTKCLQQGADEKINEAPVAALALSADSTVHARLTSYHILAHHDKLDPSILFRPARRNASNILDSLLSFLSLCMAHV